MTTQEKIEAIVNKVKENEVIKYDKEEITTEDYFDADIVLAFADIAKCLKSGNYCKDTDDSQKLLRALIKVWKIELTYEMLIPFKDETVKSFMDYYSIESIQEVGGPYSPTPSMGNILAEFYSFEDLLYLTRALDYTITDIYRFFTNYAYAPRKYHVQVEWHAPQSVVELLPKELTIDLSADDASKASAIGRISKYLSDEYGFRPYSLVVEEE